MKTSRSVLTILATALICWSCSSKPHGDASSTWGTDYFPNVPLVTHEGKKVRFFDDLIQGKVVVINFIFTHCPDSCPLETARLREVQKILGDRVGQDVFMYSITIDPEHDTQQVLKAYAEKFQIGPGWLFLTGKEDDMILLRQKLGLVGDASQAKNLKDHNLSLIIGNQRTGRWMRSSPFENPYILATQVGSWLHNWKLASAGERSYADAPEVRNISKGEALFRTRCEACHTIGEGDAADPSMRDIGPDLLGVTRKRDWKWLTRWIKEPDKMLKEKDPLATALLAEYNNVTMPNLRLNDLEIEALLTHIGEETARVEKNQKKGESAHGGGSTTRM